MDSTLYLRVAGGLLILLAAANAWFPRHFRWREETTGLSVFTRQVFFVHTFFIGLFVLLNGLLFAVWPHLLLSGDPLADVVLGGIGSFWLCRLICQVAVYDASIWRGHRGRTIAHVAFTGLWAYLVAVCAAGVIL